MCGITGWVSTRRSPDRAILARMTAALERRGPDDVGHFFGEGCGLGHRRLSIIDLEGGHQPLVASDRRHAAVVNGEIYNFRALRAELEALGHRFATRSDSEVVLHGYRAWGAGVTERLEGMFAFAVWDGAARRLLLGRDRMGQKPLYFARLSQGGLVFGSEAKALFRHPEVSRSPSPDGLARYLAFECLPEASCLTVGMEKLRPGEQLVFDADSGQLDRRTYWRMRFASSPAVDEVARLGPARLAERLRAQVLAAVEARLVADVPLGVLLSGGVDSSFITAAMARLRSPRSVKSFCIAFEDPSFDESRHARAVADHLGVDHHEEVLSPGAMLDILPEIADFMCEPLGDASIVPTYLLSRFTRRSVKVALGGDGGDELFLGYPTFPAHRVARGLDRVLPLGARRRLGDALLAAARLLPVSTRNMSFDFKLKRFSSGLGFHADHRHQAWMGSFLPAELGALLRPAVVEALPEGAPYELVDAVHAGSDARDGLDRATLQYARLYLAGDVLAKVDRASMAASLEVRAPLLDRAMVELACAIPSALKLKGMTTKHLLKEAARPWLPAGIVDRPKKGFGVPIGRWLRGPLRPLAEALLAPDRLSREGFFEAAAVKRLLDEHLAGRADHRKPLWTLLAFQMWLERHGPGGSRT